MDLEQILNHLSVQMDDLLEREKAGEDVAEEKARVETEKKQIELRLGADDEADTLRRQLREIEKREQAREIAKSIVAETVQQQQRDQQDMVELVRKEVQGMFGGSDLQSVISDALKSTRQPSRFLGTAAEGSLVEHVAQGGSVSMVPSVRVEETGAKAEAKDIIESKSIGRFFSIIARAHRGEMFLSPGEKEFLRQTMDVKTNPLAEMTDSAGGFLIHPTWMPDILKLLRAQAIVRRAGPREVPFGKLMNQTSISTGSSASYAGENLRITPSDMTFADAPLLSPKNLTALVPVSNYLLQDYAAADTLIRDDMVQVITLAEDINFLRGNGAGGAPTGLRNIGGITTDPITVPTDGFQPSIADLRHVRAVFRNLNSGPVRLAWFFHPAFLAYLEGLTDAFGRFLLDTTLLQINDDGQSGTYDGTPFYCSTQIPTNLTTGASNNTTELMLVNMAETIVGVNQNLEVAVSNEAAWTLDGTNWNSAFQQNQTLFRAVIRHDIAHRRPSQIVVQTGVLV